MTSPKRSDVIQTSTDLKNVLAGWRSCAFTNSSTITLLDANIKDYIPLENWRPNSTFRASWQ